MISCTRIMLFSINANIGIVTETEIIQQRKRKRKLFQNLN